MKSYSPHSRQQGFILVTVLWVLVIMVMAASVFSLWVDRIRTQVTHEQDRVQTYLKAANALSIITYAYATGLKVPEGVPWPSDGKPVEVKYENLDDFMSGAPPTLITANGFLPFKNEVYDLGGGVRIFVQDRGGLVGLSRLVDMNVYKAIGSYVKPSERITAGSLRAALSDFQDADSIRSGQGAEKLDYLRAHKPEPNNAPLATPLQLRQIMGWDEVLQYKDDAWILLTFKETGGSVVNGNSAPINVLNLLMPDTQKASQLIAAREKSVFKWANQFDQFLNAGEEVSMSNVPSEGFRLWWWHAGDAAVQVYDVQFAPNTPGAGAWFVNWSLRVSLPNELAQKKTQTINHPLFKSAAFVNK